MIAKDSFIILQSGTELTGALCRVGLKSREVSYLHRVTCADLTPQAVASGLRSLPVSYTHLTLPTTSRV